MRISKAILLTLLIAAIEAGVQLLFFVGFSGGSDPTYFVHVHGLAIIIGRLLAYLSVFWFFWKVSAKDMTSAKWISPFPVIIPLVLIVMGYELMISPFIDYKEILDSFTPAGLEPYEYVFSGYTLYFKYRTIVTILLAPVLEELFFRKYLIGGLLGKYGKTMAIGVSSLLFALIHWEAPVNLIPAFLFGVISALVYLSTGRIRWSILLHLMVNLVVMTLEIHGEHYYQWLFYLDFGYLYWILFSLGIITILISLKWFSLPGGKSASITR